MRREDELAEHNDRDRMQLFDEIRKRAEAEEFARIEVEEARLTAAFSLPQSDLDESHSAGIDETRGQSVREIPKENLKNASASYKELLILNPNQPDVEQFAVQMGQLQQNLDAKRSEKDKEQSKQLVAALLQSANEKYQAEKYEQALADLQQLLEFDSPNDEALALHADVKKAKALADRLKEEEARRKIEDQEAAQPIIVVPPSQQKEEFQEIEPEVVCAIDLTVPVAKEPIFEVKKKSPRPSYKKRWVGIGMSLLIALGFVTGYVVYNNLKVNIFTERPGILILPAKTTHAAEYLVDGLTEDLIAHLSHVHALTVFTPSTAFSLRYLSPAEAAKMLGAEYYLEWSIDRSGTETNFALSWIHTVSGQRKLEQSYTLSGSQLASFSSMAVPAFTNAASVDANNLIAVFKPVTTNSEAYESYLLGRYLLNHPNHVSLDSVAAVFNQARRSDPEFPYTEAALGWVEILAHESSADITMSHIESAGRHLQRAMNLGARNAEVYRLWGLVEFYRANYAHALERLEHAIDLAPSDAEAYRRLAIAYTRAGRADDAVLAARQSAQCDPFHSATRNMLAMLLMITGDNAGAVAEFEAEYRRQTFSPQKFSEEYLASLVAVNRHERALDLLRERVRVSPKDFIAQYDLGRMYQLAGKPKADWEKILQRALKSIADTLAVNPSGALAYSYRGLVQTRLGLFGEGAKSNMRALELAPSNITIVFNSARMFALQRGHSDKALPYLSKTLERKFSLASLLDLDLIGLRKDALTVAVK